MNSIETEHLTKRFRLLRSYRDLAAYPLRRTTKLAVEDLSIGIGTGELFGLLGENGAGKTTLIRMLSTTLLPTEGRALVAGVDVVRDPQRVRRLIGVVSSDERSFYWRLTGRENLAYFATLYHLPDRRIGSRIEELLRVFGLTEVADRPFNSYSAGTRQKLAIARGLLTDPKVLFLDEPTRSLDPITADELRRHVVDHVVGELGTTVLLATHTLSEAEAICHRIGIIRRGRLVAEGTMDALRARMILSTRLELVLEGGPAGLDASLRGVPGVTGVVVEDEADQTRLGAEYDGSTGILDDILRIVTASDVRVRSISTRQPTLEDIYRAVHATDGSEAA